MSCKEQFDCTKIQFQWHFFKAFVHIVYHKHQNTASLVIIHYRAAQIHSFKPGSM